MSDDIQKIHETNIKDNLQFILDNFDKNAKDITRPNHLMGISISCEKGCFIEHYGTDPCAMQMGIDLFNLPLLKEAVKDWQDGKLSDGAAMMVVAQMVTPQRPPSQKEIEYAQKLAEEDKQKMLNDSIKWDGNNWAEVYKFIHESSNLRGHVLSPDNVLSLTAEVGNVLINVGDIINKEDGKLIIESEEKLTNE